MADSLKSKPLSSFFEISPALLNSYYARPHRFHKTKLADFTYREGHWVRCPETICSNRNSLPIDSITTPSRFILINDSQKVTSTALAHRQVLHQQCLQPLLQSQINRMPNRPSPLLSHTRDCHQCLSQTFRRSWLRVQEGHRLARLYLRATTLELRASHPGPVGVVRLAQRILWAVLQEVLEVDHPEEGRLALEVVEEVHLDPLALFRDLDRDFLQAESILRKYRRLQQLYTLLSSSRR